MSLLLDSVILIDHFNGVAAATEFIREHDSEIHLSVITRAEVLAGFALEQWPAAKSILDYFPNLPISVKDAERAARFRRQHRWRLPDALQAAVAHNHELILVTRNTRDFDPSIHAFVLVPYRI